jgi:hypothetical protein
MYAFFMTNKANSDLVEFQNFGSENPETKGSV